MRYQNITQTYFSPWTVINVASYIEDIKPKSVFDSMIFHLIKECPLKCEVASKSFGISQSKKFKSIIWKDLEFTERLTMILLLKTMKSITITKTTILKMIYRFIYLLLQTKLSR